MNLINQVVEDKRVMDAQQGVLRFSVFKAQRELTESRLPGIASAFKDAASEEMLVGGVKRSLFSRFLKSRDPALAALYTFYDSVNAALELQAGSQRQVVEIRKLTRLYLRPESPWYLGKVCRAQPGAEAICATTREQLENWCCELHRAHKERQLALRERKAREPPDPELGCAAASPASSVRDESPQDRSLSARTAQSETTQCSDATGINALQPPCEAQVLVENALGLVLCEAKRMLPDFVSSKYGESLLRYENYALKPRRMQDFERLRVLGEGGFGKVHAVRVRDTGGMYALKEMSKVRIITKSRVNTVLNEAKILKKCNYPFCAKLHQVFTDDTSIYFLLEILTGGEIKFHLKRMPEIENDVSQFWAACLVLGIAYLHSRNVIHRDLKPSNAILDADGYVCISDFGLSVTGDDEEEEVRHTQCCGTPGYIAPEMYLGPAWDKRSRGASSSRKGSTTMRSSFVNSIQSSMRRFTTRTSKVDTVEPDQIPQPSTALSSKPQLLHQDTIAENTRRRSAVLPPTSMNTAAVPTDFEELQRQKFHDTVINRTRSASTSVAIEKPSDNFPRYKDYGKSVDWFALGVILHQFYCLGRMPFTRGPKRSHRTMLHNIMNGNVRWSDMAARRLEKNTALARKHRRDPKHFKAPTTGLTPDAKDLIERLLHFDPEKRLGCGPDGAKEVMRHRFFKNMDWERLEKRHILPPFRPPSNRVNAEFQHSEWEGNEATRRERRKSLALTDEKHAKIFEDLEWVRRETFFEELANCDVDYDALVGDEEATQKRACLIM